MQNSAFILLDLYRNVSWVNNMIDKIIDGLFYLTFISIFIISVYLYFLACIK